MKAGDFRFNAFMAVLATAVASSVLGFAILVLSGQLDLTAMREPVKDVPVVAAIVLIWVPAFAFIPAAILGWLVERPKARRLIERRAGGLGPHLALSVAAALALWLLFRIVLVLANSTPQLMDAASMALLALVGLSSGVSWWFIVVLPGRRE